MNTKSNGIAKKLFYVAAMTGGFHAASAYAISIPAGDWQFNFNGYVNGYLTVADCDNGGATVAGQTLLCTGDDDAASVSNGYSPASFSLGASTNQNGYDISATIAIEPGTTTNGAFNTKDDGEAYRAFLTVGNAEMGTVKAGRDYGVFGIDVILQDMSLTGVGAPYSTRSPANTTLGGAGYGYIFVDRLSQITYTSPKMGAVTATVGIYQPLDVQAFFAGGASSDSGSSIPGLHGRLHVDLGNGNFISTTALSQEMNNIGTGSKDYTASAFDVTGKFSAGDFSFVASAFTAEGVGYYGLFLDSAAADGTARDSSGWFAQATYQAGDTKFGINYGESSLDKAGADADTLVDTQSKVTVGVYHALTSNVSLAAEYSQVTAESHAGGEIENDAVSLGVSMAF